MAEAAVVLVVLLSIPQGRREDGRPPSRKSQRGYSSRGEAVPDVVVVREDRQIVHRRGRPRGSRRCCLVDPLLALEHLC